MFPAKLVFVTALCFSVFFNLVSTGEVTRDAMSSPTDCANCPTCQCPPSIPIPGGYPLYGPPPPGPPPPPSTPSYPYIGPPPPPQQRGIGKCPPTQPGQCCQYPQYLSPPGASRGYVPYPDNHAGSSPLSMFLSVMMLLFSSSAVFF